MSCKLVFLPDEKATEGYCIIEQDIEALPTNKADAEHFYLPGKDIIIDRLSYGIFRSPKNKAFVAVPTGRTYQDSMVYALKALSTDKPTDQDIAQGYVNLKKLGQGSYGSVSHYPVEGIVVKTTMHRHKGIPPDIVREISIYRLISLLNCTPELYDFLRDYEHNVSELVLEKGVSTLADKRGRLPFETMRKLFFRIIQCMRVISSQGIIHADLKPENIIISQDDSAQIIDWGLAQIDYTKGQYQDKSLVGTLWYNAPEILLGFQDYTHKIDIFSLGLTFGKMVFDLEVHGDDSTEQAYFYLSYFHDIDPTLRMMPEKILDELEYYIDLTEDLIESSKKSIAIEFKNAKEYPVLLDLVARMLVINPDMRIDYDDILRHPFFGGYLMSVPDLPVFLNNMPIIDNIENEWAMKSLDPYLRLTYFAPLSNSSGNVNAVCLAFQLADMFVIKTEEKLDEYRISLAVNVAYNIACKVFNLDSEQYETENEVLMEDEILQLLQGNILIATLASYYQHYLNEDQQPPLERISSQYLQSDIYAKPFKERMHE